MKVERLKSEVKQEKELVSEISKQLTANNLLEKVSKCCQFQAENSGVT